MQRHGNYHRRFQLEKGLLPLPYPTQQQPESLSHPLTPAKLQLQDALAQHSAIKPVNPRPVKMKRMYSANAAEIIRRIPRPCRGEWQATASADRALPRLDALPARPANTQCSPLLNFTTADGTVRRKNDCQQALSQFAEHNARKKLRISPGELRLGSRRRLRRISEQSLLLLFLALDTMPGPRNRVQPLSLNLFLTSDAQTVGPAI